MTNYRHGADLERAVKKLFEANGYYVIKSGGSKGPADLVALKRGETVLVQCKLDGYLLPKDRKDLWCLAQSVGARNAVVASWRKEGRAARQVHLTYICYMGREAGFVISDWSPDWALEET